MRRLLLAVLLVAGAIAAVAKAPEAGAAVPAGFTDELVTAIAAPTGFAFTHDGRILITRQAGTVEVFEDGALLPTPALSLGSAVCTEAERGLLGIALDPDFELNGFVYLFYTFNKNPPCTTGADAPVNRLSRFTMTGDTIDPASELVLLDNMPSTGANHNAGDVQFGSDGNLYVTIGDGGCDYAGDSGCAGSNDAARDQHTLTGKLLRITPTGGIPVDNPFVGTDADACALSGGTAPGRRCRETFAWGFRNPFRFAQDPNSVSPRLFVNDVGQDQWEEVDLVLPGGDYGWNCREGASVNATTGKCNPTPPGMIDPIFAYRHGVQVPGTSSPSNCTSITGGAFVPNGAWPAAYDGSYFIGDFVCGRIFRLTQGAGGLTASDFATNLGNFSVVHLGFGPRGAQQALYYATRTALRRIYSDDPPAYIPVAPARIVDTRPAFLDNDGFNTKLGPGGSIDVPVTGRGGVPTNGVAAVALNVTVTNVAEATHLTVYPRGEPPPLASNLNLASEQTAANAVVAKVGVGGRVSIRNNSGDVDVIVDVMGWFPTGSNVYEPLSPVRILDTRPGELDGDGHDSAMAGGDTINVDVAGRGGVPEDAQAVAMNVTITDNFVLTFLTLYPGGTERPHASNLNAGGFRTTPNLAVTKLGEDGSVDIFNAQGHAHVILDVAGYVPAGTTEFVPVAPVRILDTRPFELDGDGHNSPVPANQSIEVSVGGVGGVPANARAVVINVTATEGTNPTHLTVFPLGAAFPATSNLNLAAGENRANLVIAKLGTDGKVVVHNAVGSTHVIFDVAGWFP